VTRSRIVLVVLLGLLGPGLVLVVVRAADRPALTRAAAPVPTVAAA